MEVLVLGDEHEAAGCSVLPDLPVRRSAESHAATCAESG
jgi:hypothetical protein